MSDFDRVAWSEGMFLRPQHFQQQERYLRQEAATLYQHLNQYSWGVADLELDTSSLKEGQIVIKRCVAILPDRAAVLIPERDHEPEPLVVDSHVTNSVVYLLVPHAKQRELNVADQSEDNVTRYCFGDHVSVDETDGHDEEVIQLAKLNVSLKVSQEPVAGFHNIAVARIASVSSDGEIRLDTTFVPPCLSTNRNAVLGQYLHDVIAMVKQRADALASRMSQGKGAVTSAADFMMLQVLNRYESTLRLLNDADGVHPFDLCRHFYGLIGELSTFSAKDKRPPALPRYNHQDLSEVFAGAFNILNQCLSVVLEQTASRLPLELSQFGIRVSPINDKKLLESAQFVLAVKADIEGEEIRRRFPSQVKIGPVEHIRDLVNNQLQGIGAKPLPVAPRQIPYHAGFQYFELDKTNNYWTRLSASGGIALHVSGQYPELELELWSINQ